jgi:hypothetical protein
MGHATLREIAAMVFPKPGKRNCLAGRRKNEPPGLPATQEQNRTHGEPLAGPIAESSTISMSWLGD